MTPVWPAAPTASSAVTARGVGLGVPPPVVAAAPLWAAVQALGVTLTGALLLSLVLAPEPTLAVLWKVVIPLVPAVLLVSPLLWRNACPLATLNLLANGPGGAKTRGRATRIASATGIALFLLLVPARRFLFNVDGPALAGAILAVAGVAVLLGALFDAKTGFCAGICPVLPVERLYGQSPLIRIGNARCASCTACARACLDLSPRKSIRQLLGPARSSAAWVLTPFGAFAAGFPGFVFGYFTLSDVGLSQAAAVYAHVGLWTAVSWAVVAGLALLPGASAARLLPTLGAAAAGLYYWFAVPDLSATLGLPAAGADHLRVAALGLVVAWWVGARTRTKRPGIGRSVPSAHPPGGSSGFGPLPPRGRTPLPRPERFP